MITLKTESGSTYLIDTENKTAHKEGKVNPDAPRMSSQAKKYKHLHPIEIGKSLIVEWDPNADGEHMFQPATITSPVVSVTEDTT